MAKTTCSAMTSIALLCLGFTGTRLAWADQAQVRERWVDNPYAAHDTTGNELRLGSLVAIMAIDGTEYTGLGGLLAIGHRWGRLALDAEYGYLELTERGPSSTRFGVAHNLGVNARWELLRLGSRVVGPNSMTALYVEAGAGRQFRRGDPVAYDETVRRHLATGQATMLSGGFGVMFDHRLEQPRGFPNRIGWQLGWRVLSTPRPAPDSYVTCRGADCTAAPAPGGSMQVGIGDTSLVVSSSLAFTW